LAVKQVRRALAETKLAFLPSGAALAVDITIR
jgi:hypothetical protein